MKSMTGYAYGEYRGERFHLSLDLRSYNSRFLELSISLPPYLGSLEPRVRDYLTERIARGKVELYLHLIDLEEPFIAVVDKKAVESYLHVLRELSELAGIREEITVRELIGLDGVLKTERSPDVDAYWTVIEPHLKGLFADFEEARLREGAHTCADVLEKLGLVEAALEMIAAQSGALEAAIKRNLQERFREVLGESVDEARVMTETAVLLVKFDISEEIVRIRGHLESFRREVDAGGAIGKKLDFICQELTREVNTIGSKSTIIEVNRAVIDIKDALEKIREQLRNVE